jgi:hypothetical protein
LVTPRRRRGRKEIKEVDAAAAAGVASASLIDRTKSGKSMMLIGGFVAMAIAAAAYYFSSTEFHSYLATRVP